MKKGLTELVFILDRSGSMSGLERDTIGGFNGLLQKQKAEPGEAILTTVLFDNHFELLHDRMDLRDVEPITAKEYFVRGSTALLDAVGKTVNKTKSAHKHIAKKERPENVMFVITTDGMENASMEFSYAKIHEMVERQKNQHGWEFLFLGANIDAVDVASRFGISQDRAAEYHADSAGTMLNYQALCATVSSLRDGRPISGTWKESIEQDFNERLGKKTT